MILDNSLTVACGDVVVAAATRSVAVAGDVAAAVGVADADDVVVVVGATTVVVVWVQRCWMKACTNPQSHLVSVVVTLRGKKPSWWYWKTTQGPHSTMGRLVGFQPWC